MSRTYYEWMAAKQEWHYSQKLRIASIPYPGEVLQYPVIYKRESSNPFWQRRYNDALSKLHPTSLNFSSEITSHLFNQIADIEEQKELALINQFLPAEDISDTDTLTQKINILMQGRDRYNKLLKRISAALEKTKSSGAPNMSTFFATYLEPILIQKMEQFQNEFITLSNPKDRYMQLINEAMREASTRMARASIYQNPNSNKKEKTRSTAGGSEDWREINQALKSDPAMWDLFVKNVMKSIGNWDDLYGRLIQEDVFGSQQAIQDKLKLKSRTFSIGGNVAENAMAAVAVRLNRMRGGNSSMKYSVSGGAITAEGPATADSFVIFSADTTVDASAIFNEFNNATEKDYRQKLQSTVNTFQNNLNQLFGIFINAKNYAIGKGQSAEYTKTIGGSFADLPATFEEFNVNIPDIEDFLMTAYNTGAGAIAENMRGWVEESLVHALRAAVAKIMFDDYATIGDMSQGNLIHLYQLDGKFVPSSIIFRKLSEATAEMVSVKANVNLPGDVSDPGKDGWDGNSDAEIKENIWQHWQDESMKAQAAATWMASFTLKVKTVLQNIQ